MNAVETAVSETSPTESSVPAWVVSLCFWTVLLTAGSLFGAVALASKFSVWDRVRTEYRHNAEHLVALEEQVSYLERVEAALKSDPEFVQRLAGSKLDQQDRKAELIPVSGDLIFGYEPVTAAAMRNESPPPFYRAVIESLATHRRLRSALLTISALMTIFAFACLNDAGGGLIRTISSGVRTAAIIPLSRYYVRQSQANGD